MTAAPTNLLPGASLYSVASIRLHLREVQVYNTTITAAGIALVRLTTTGTQGAAITEAKYDADQPAIQGTAFNSHTVGPTITDELVRGDLGAAVGSGVIWTFDVDPIRIPPATTNGVGLITPTGTGQICDVVFVWEE
jgi:hypothetical protein